VTTLAFYIHQSPSVFRQFITPTLASEYLSADRQAGARESFLGGALAQIQTTSIESGLEAKKSSTCSR